MSNADDILKALNLVSTALDGLGQWNISHQKLIDMKAAKNGEPFTEADLTELYQDNKTTLNTLIGDE